MNTKKKLWWSLGALAMTLIVAATSVGITIAALQAKVQSGFSITYTAKHVHCVMCGVLTISVNVSYDNYSTAILVPGSPFKIDGQEYVEISKNENVSDKKFENLDFNFTSDDIKNSVVPILIRQGKITSEQEFDSSKFSIGENHLIMFSFSIVNLDKDNPLPVHFEVKNLSQENIESTSLSIDPSETAQSDGSKATFTIPAGKAESMSELIELAKQQGRWEESKNSYKTIFNIESDEAVATFVTNNNNGRALVSFYITLSSLLVNTEVSGNFAITLGA